jgi:quinol monooxygenase YgiN
MITEHAWLTVTPGREEEFAESITAALPIIMSAQNCHGAWVQRQVEDPSIFLLSVQWTSVQDHMNFRDSALFAQWRSQTQPYYSGPADVTHFEDVPAS